MKEKTPSSPWISVEDQLPEHYQRVLVFIPNNKVYPPGKSLEFEIREVVIMYFLRDFYGEGSEKWEKYGPHFWQGEGNSNHFFSDVSHWMPIPENPEPNKNS